MKSKVTRVLALTLAVSLPGLAVARDASNSENNAIRILKQHKEKSENAQSFRFDMSTPTAPGFVVIGASPTDVAQPGNLQELVVDTFSFGENGSIKPGLAISFQPHWLFNDTQTLEEYSGFQFDGSAHPNGLTPFERILARTQLSIATVQGADASITDGARIGIGGHTELIDARDLRNIDSARCQIDAYKNAGGAVALKSVIDGTAVLPGFDATAMSDEQFQQLVETYVEQNYDPEQYREAEAQCRKEAAEQISNSPSWMLGAGFALSSVSGDFDDVNYAGASVWSTYFHPFGKNKFVTLFGQADIDHSLTANGVTGSVDAYRAAMSFGFEETNSWKLEATTSYHTQQAELAALDDSYFQFAVGGAFKVRNGLWLEASFGTRSGSKTQDDSFSLLQMKIDLSEPANNFLVSEQ